ncbi:MAG: DsbA family protein [Deltaproteobacteria bacterium]|nr:DsbA family protein [Deltaproteobacteria bacterium]
MPDKANPGAVKVELYAMSQCPYGVQAENGFKDAVEKLGADVDFRVEFIGQTSPTGELTSMHGPKEVKGDMVQACAQKHTPKWFQLILCQNKNMREVDTNWEACASEVGAPVDKLRACVDGEEGKELLKASFEKANQKGARGSPTIYIGGNQYGGGRRPADFMKAICNAYTGKKPAACSDIPESPKVNVTILTDKRCEECDPRRLQGTISRVVANPVLKTLDYADAEGKKLYDAIKPAKLPLAVFDATLEADKEAMGAIGQRTRAVGTNKVLEMGGSWNPACADEGGCKLDECKNEMACKPEVPGQLEVFVMSECPFGVKGLNAMEEVLANFEKSKAKIDFKIHFIGDGDAQKLTSMHGQSEVDEDIREICAIEHYGKGAKYMNYILCRNKNIRDKNWESCATKDTGVDAAVIKKCFEGDEGKGLLATSFGYSKGLGIGASPTWLANGKYKFSGIDPETVKTEFCKHNKLPGCENKLSGQAPSAAGAAAPAGCGG